MNYIFSKEPKMPDKKSKVKVRSKPAEKDTTQQKELIVVMIISLLLGLGGGYLIGTGLAENGTNTTTAKTEQVAIDSHTSTYEVLEAGAPKVELVVAEDAKSGYNVKIIATNFTFTPENANGENILGEGHAHLYIDGVKVGRLYSPYFHYDGSFEGTKEFKVTLNANDHSEYAVGGKVIDAKVMVTHDSSSKSHDEVHKDSNNHMNSGDTHSEI